MWQVWTQETSLSATQVSTVENNPRWCFPWCLLSTHTNTHNTYPATTLHTHLLLPCKQVSKQRNFIPKTARRKKNNHMKVIPTLAFVFAHIHSPPAYPTATLFHHSMFYSWPFFNIVDNVSSFLLPYSISSILLLSFMFSATHKKSLGHAPLKL